MADTPTPRSYSQTLGDMFDAFLSKQGIRSLRVGGPIVSILEAAAQSDLRNAQDIFNLLTSADLDNATGLALSRIGDKEGVPKLEIRPATGTVTISDTSFVKKSTKLFQGSPAPIVGSVTINVVDASSFPAPGPNTKIYIGRGTSNYEGPIRYTGLTNVGSYWQLTLATGTAKFHNTSEMVILAQGGNRVIGPNTTVKTPQANTAAAISFSTLFQVTLPDGETDLPNVDVAAQVSGLVGNVIAGAISEFAQAPFDGAAVTNPSPFTNGRETESDNDYRERIRDVRASRQLATTLAIETAVTGITAPDESKRISSASLVKRFGFPSTLYVDDGTGYEERTAAIAFESIFDSAVGGENHGQTTQRPIARAFAISKNVAPFVLHPNDELTVKVGGIPYTHTFAVTDFQSITNASAYEIVASINSNPNIGFVARTANSGTQVVVFANSDTNEDIEVIAAANGTDANDGIGFPAGVNYTMRLYKNDRLLTKDGKVASVNSLPFAQWDPMTGTQTLQIRVDNTTSITFGITNQAFIDAGTGFATVGRNSLEAWAAVLNNIIPGVTTTVNSGRLVVTSNAGASARAAVSIDGGTLVSAHVFPIVSDQGAASDYTLDRNEAQISLAKILQAGDRLTAGSLATRAFLESEAIGTTTLASDALLWFVVDGGAEIIQHGVTPSTPLTFTVSKSSDWGNLLKVDATPSMPFGNVHAEDWVVLWDAALPASLQGTFRISKVEGDGSAFYIERPAMVSRRTWHKSVGLDPGVSATPRKILTTGGGLQPRADGNFLNYTFYALNTCELFDPSTNTSTPCASMNQPRMMHTLTLLPSGKVLAVGGKQDQGPTNTIEIYDPVADSWTMSAASLATGVFAHTATLLNDGRVLITGGTTGFGGNDSYQIYTPGTDSISGVFHMGHARARHQAVLVASGKVVVIGGFDAVGNDQNTVEIFTPGPDTFVAGNPMTRARSGFGAADYTHSGTESIIVAGNNYGSTGNHSYEIYAVVAGTWGAETTLTNTIFEEKDLVKLSNGKVVGLDGYSSVTQSVSIGFEWDGATITNTVANPLTAEDGSGRFNGQYVEVKNGTGSIQNKIATIGGDWEQSSTWKWSPTSQIQIWDFGSNTWSAPDAAAPLSSVSLTQVGIAFARTDSVVHEINVPTGTNYTASSLVDSLNAGLDGATASVYRTTQMRISTDTFTQGGDIALVTQNLAAAALQLTPTSAITNLVPHMGSVQSGSDTGTPSFQLVNVASQAKGTPNRNLIVSTPTITADSTIVGLKPLWRGTDVADPFQPAAYLNTRASSNYKYVSHLLSQAVIADSNGPWASQIMPRVAPTQPWGAMDRIYMAAPYAISPNGTLDVIVDNDPTQQFNINMWRTLTPVGATYATTNTFKDGDAGGVSLATTFGLGYDFNDFAVYMHSRALAFSGDANRAQLFRYKRLGSDGDNARVRFGNPLAANSSVKVQTAFDTSGFADVTVQLASGSLRTPTIHNATRVGRAVLSKTAGGTASVIHVLNLLISSATRDGANHTTLTLTLPPGVGDCGFSIGDNVWVNSTDVNFSSGLKTLIGKTFNTITYTEIAAAAGPDANIGTVSGDQQGEATFSGSSTVAGDWIRFTDPTNVAPPYGNITFQIQSVTDQYAITDSGDQLDGSTLTVLDILNWQPVMVSTRLAVFANANQTATQIATAINTLAGAANSTCPITDTIVSTGTGVISQNSCDQQDNPKFWYQLSDGVNWVRTTTSPGSSAGDYQLTFKNPITGSLSTGADWANETVRIAPITADDVTEWLNTPTISGLFTDCEITVSNDGRSVQIATLTPGSAGGIQVAGGLANSINAAVVGIPTSVGNSFFTSTVSALDSTGMARGMWARIQNENPLPKLPVLHSGLVLNSWSVDGQLQFSGNVVTTQVAPYQVKVQIEKQGEFIAISDIGSAATTRFWTNISQGSWLRLTPPTSPTISAISAPNQGLFRVISVATTGDGHSGTIWIENSNAIEETSECTLAAYSANSVMPGDKLTVLDPLWGSGNLGVWPVKAVGTTTATSNDPFSNTTSFVVDVSERTPIPQGTAPALTTATAALIYLLEGVPAVYVARIHGITPNQSDGSFVDVMWETALTYSSVSASAGSVISVLDKLAFPTDFTSGADGYRYDTGLLREANRVVYGDRANPTNYPGVAAADSHINIQGPLVHRVQVGLSIRVKTGLNTQDIANRVRSAVATVINQTGIGDSIAFSDIIDAARDVIGVVSVAIVSPLYSVDHDQIEVQPYEKPYVLDLSQDIQVSFLGT